MLHRILAVICCITLLLAMAGCKKEEAPTTPTVVYPRASVASAVCAKLEYSGTNGNSYKLVAEDGIDTLDALDTMALKGTDEPFSGDWVYRFTFEMENGDLLVVLFGESSVCIDGQNFVSQVDGDYKVILAWAKTIYTTAVREVAYS